MWKSCIDWLATKQTLKRVHDTQPKNIFFFREVINDTHVCGRALWKSVNDTQTRRIQRHGKNMKKSRTEMLFSPTTLYWRTHTTYEEDILRSPIHHHHHHHHHHHTKKTWEQHRGIDQSSFSRENREIFSPT